MSGDVYFKLSTTAVSTYSYPAQHSQNFDILSDIVPLSNQGLPKGLFSTGFSTHLSYLGDLCTWPIFFSHLQSFKSSKLLNNSTILLHHYSEPYIIIMIINFLGLLLYVQEHFFCCNGTAFYRMSDHIMSEPLFVNISTPILVSLIVMSSNGECFTVVFS